jgi:hypothetical protein
MIMTTKKINKAIKHLRLEVTYTYGDGYFYFLDLKTGNQVGDSIFVCYLKQLTLEQWVDEAEEARSKFPITGE